MTVAFTLITAVDVVETVVETVVEIVIVVVIMIVIVIVIVVVIVATMIAAGNVVTREIIIFNKVIEEIKTTIKMIGVIAVMKIAIQTNIMAEEKTMNMSQKSLFQNINFAKATLCFTVFLN